ncbi:MAG TPA: alkaline phosphatase family protein [Gammaproteobacteria bacterium]|jgi:phospholipase C
MKKFLYVAAAFGLTSILAACGGNDASGISVDDLATATPIKHLVVIYGENVSFDHYFGTYPRASNPAGEPAFTAVAGTPSANVFTEALLKDNPNLTNAANGTGVSNPFRLDRSQAATADMNHDYTAEQQAYDDGAADAFPEFTGTAETGAAGAFGTTGLVMGYYDGNTVTALWNYAQHYAMNDNSYSDQYGPSSPGAINVISGQTNGFVVGKSSFTDYFIDDGHGSKTLMGDVDPTGDVCSSSTDQGSLKGKNIGDLLSAKGVSWGWFEGGFDLALTNLDGSTGCSRTHTSSVTNSLKADYIPHHQPFQYYASTANPTHARPSSTAMIGSQDAANHQYDLQDFFTAVKSGNFPAVTYLKASGFQDAHAGYSDPLDEQTFVTEVVNFLEQQPDWGATAVIIMYDDSDGWYDHQFAKVGNGSFNASVDQLTAAGACGVKGSTPQAGGVAGAGAVNGRCGPGARQPFIVISPWAKANFVDHTQITQASVVKFIEDNWLGGQRLGGGSFDASTGSIDGMFDFQGGGKNPKLFLDENQGTEVSKPGSDLPQ